MCYYPHLIYEEPKFHRVYVTCPRPWYLITKHISPASGSLGPKNALYWQRIASDTESFFYKTGESVAQTRTENVLCAKHCAKSFVNITYFILIGPLFRMA